MTFQELDTLKKLSYKMSNENVFYDKRDSLYKMREKTLESLAIIVYRELLNRKSINELVIDLIDKELLKIERKRTRDGYMIYTRDLHNILDKVKLINI